MRDEAAEKLQRHFQDRLSIFLESLARGKQFKQAIGTPLGKMLLNDATIRLENLIDKVIREESTPEERAEVRALRTIIDRWSGIINKYMSDRQTYNKVTGE